MFGRILTFLQNNPLRTQIRERNGRRSFVIGDVKTVTDAHNLLSSILTLDPSK